MQAPFTLHPHQTAVAIAFRPSSTALIADELSPRVPVGGPLFSYNEFAKGMMFTVPDTEVGRTSAPPQVTYKAEEREAKVLDQGLDIPVPYADVEAWRANQAAGDKITADPTLTATEVGTALILLRREARVAAMYTSASNYGQSVVLSSGDQWDDLDSDPMEVIDGFMENMVMPANLAWCGLKVFNRLRRNKTLVREYFGAGGNNGRLSRDQLAEVLGFKKMLVGEGWINTAAEGETPNLVRCWGNDFGAVHVDMQATNRFGITFGFTGQFGTRQSGQVLNPDMGVRGGVKVRTYESVRELIIAPDLGFIIKDAVAA